MLGMEVTTHRYGSGNVMCVQHDQLHEVLLQLGRARCQQRATVQRNMDMTFRSWKSVSGLWTGLDENNCAAVLS
jgi:hypothetical protein